MHRKRKQRKQYVSTTKTVCLCVMFGISRFCGGFCVYFVDYLNVNEISNNVLNDVTQH